MQHRGHARASRTIGFQNPVPKIVVRRGFPVVSPHVAVFSDGPRREATQDGVRRVIILSIETHPDMMSIVIVYWTGYSCGHASCAAACALPAVFPRTSLNSHVTPDAFRRPRRHITHFNRTHRATVHRHALDESQERSQRQRSHSKVPHRCPRPACKKPYVYPRSEYACTSHQYGVRVLARARLAHGSA